MSKTKRTPGEWKVYYCKHSIPTIYSGDQCITDRVFNGNETFIAMAGTTANKLDAIGYDGEAAIKMLPELLETLRNARACLLNLQPDGGPISQQMQKMIGGISETIAKASGT